MNALFKTIRKITVPPVFAAILLIIVYTSYPEEFHFGHLIGAIIFLTLLPLLAYPMQKHIPKYKDRGREGQRSLAMIFSFAGYSLGTIVSYLSEAPVRLKLIYFEYLLCGIAILLINKAFHLKASGHACGIVGPVVMLLSFGLWIPAAIGAVIVVPVYISSIITKQHTLPQLLEGSAIPIAVRCILAPFFLL